MDVFQAAIQWRVLIELQSTWHYGKSRIQFFCRLTQTKDLKSWCVCLCSLNFKNPQFESCNPAASWASSATDCRENLCQIPTLSLCNRNYSNIHKFTLTFALVYIYLEEQKCLQNLGKGGRCYQESLKGKNHKLTEYDIVLELNLIDVKIKCHCVCLKFKTGALHSGLRISLPSDRDISRPSSIKCVGPVFPLSASLSLFWFPVKSNEIIPDDLFHVQPMPCAEWGQYPKRLQNKILIKKNVNKPHYKCM